MLQASVKSRGELAVELREKDADASTPHVWVGSITGKEMTVRARQKAQLMAACGEFHMKLSNFFGWCTNISQRKTFI